MKSRKERGKMYCLPFIKMTYTQDTIFLPLNTRNTCTKWESQALFSLYIHAHYIIYIMGLIFHELNARN